MQDKIHDSGAHADNKLDSIKAASALFSFIIVFIQTVKARPIYLIHQQVPPLGHAALRMTVWPA